MGVVVVGAVNTDLVIVGSDIALPGRTVLADAAHTAPGGKGGNQAAAVARLGGRCRLIARVGTDPDGDRAVTDLAGAGVDTGLVGRDGTRTGMAVVMLDRAGENAITVVPGANGTLTAAHVDAALDGVEGVGVLLASLEVPLDAVVRAASVARERGWTVVLNPAPARALPDGLLRCVDVIVPNEYEYAALGGDGLLVRGVGAVVVTLGARGCSIVRAGREPVAVPAKDVDVVDTTGAGDAFCAALAWALDRGHPLERAAGLANTAGALATRAVGARAALATEAELE